MAGPWLKIECSTPDKPHMLAITAAMGWDDPDLAFAKLFRLWRWFDQHTIDGNAAGVTPALLDRVIGVTGFVQAVANVGWLVVTESGIRLCRFDEHNGDTAKNRAQTAKRVAEHKSNAKGNGECNANTVTKTVPRGRGRDISSSLRSEESAPKRSTRKCPASFEVTAELIEWAAESAPGANLKTETEKFRDHTFKTAHSDWVGAWRNWMRRAHENLPKARASPESFRERDQRAAIEQAQRFAPGIAARMPGDPPPHFDFLDMEDGNVPALESP